MATELPVHVVRAGEKKNAKRRALAVLVDIKSPH
jgi:hypothetical protein